jgi:hypothetical protein
MKKGVRRVITHNRTGNGMGLCRKNQKTPHQPSWGFEPGSRLLKAPVAAAKDGESAAEEVKRDGCPADSERMREDPLAFFPPSLG